MKKKKRSYNPHLILTPVSWKQMKLTHPAVILTIILRILAALYILIDPWWGLVATLVMDWVDSQILFRCVRYTEGMYH